MRLPQRHIAVQRPDTHDQDGEAKGNLKSQIALILRTESRGRTATVGLLASGSSPTSRATRSSSSNACGWRGCASGQSRSGPPGQHVKLGCATRPFRPRTFQKGTETVVRLKKERSEAMVCTKARPSGSLLAVAEAQPFASLWKQHWKPGCRKGALLSLQWSQVRFQPKANCSCRPRRPRGRPTESCRCPSRSMRSRAQRRPHGDVLAVDLTPDALRPARGVALQAGALIE